MKVHNKYFENVSSAIEKGGEISPFLFLSSHLELLHADIMHYIQDIFHQQSIDIQSLFHLSDTGENIKIEEIKKFIAQWDVRARYAFQIFFIENISRMTSQAQNACLKFFEEPGEGNIVILTNQSEAGVLETILSRVHIQHIFRSFSPEAKNVKQDFYFSMIGSHISGNSDELVRYFFSGKYEKAEYIEFLKMLMFYITQSSTYIHLLDDLQEDIWWILKNNLQGKYVVDKYIMLLKA